MPRPILRLATRLNRRTRLTAWAIAFACMVLVGSLGLIDGMSAGVDSVTSRFQLGPVVYLRGGDLLASSIDPVEPATIPGNYSALRVHVGTLSINNISIEVVVASLEAHEGGTTSVAFPGGPREVALDAGLAQEIASVSGRPPGATLNLTLFGRTESRLAVAPPPASRPSLFPDTWAWVTPALLVAMDPALGAPLQAVLTAAPLDPVVVAGLGLTSLNTVGAIGFVRESVSEARAALDVLSLVIGAVIVLLVLSAMSLEVRQRDAELRTLRSLGASPGTLAALVGGRAVLLAVLGATLGSALGIVAAHAVVSFAPLLGMPNLIVLSPPYEAVLLAYAMAVGASLVGAAPPASRAAALARGAKGAVPS